MLTTEELKLLNADVSKFPLMKLVLDARKRCGGCGHKGVGVRDVLRIAAARYAKDPEFIKLCSSLFPLPCMIGGWLIK